MIAVVGRSYADTNFPPAWVDPAPVVVASAAVRCVYEEALRRRGQRVSGLGAVVDASASSDPRKAVVMMVVVTALMASVIGVPLYFSGRSV